MIKKYGPTIFQADRAGIQNQVGEVLDKVIAVDKPSWYDYKFLEHEPQGPFNQNPGPPQRGNQTVETWKDKVEIPGELYRESPNHVSCPPTGLTHAETKFRTQ
ncbi:hypothetical protein AYI68_g5784 [Smittium mucronatum]|uniref:Uncharacterized protein n=1 Tax=Smittium mucronatum TaxID=133383 RepID=A0A1R0GTB0_9FUNG|nr:hypothetical protein AYI68_g5784 [Smittium mucronatum]